jgi:hypothetical protein
MKMHIVKVFNYRKLLQSVRLSGKHSIVTVTAHNCPMSNNLRARLDIRQDLNIDVFDIPYETKLPIGHLFEIRSVPTAILLEHGMPIARADQSFEIDKFIETVEDVVVYDRNPFE